MQDSRTTSDGGGWSRRTRVIVLIAVPAVFAVWFAVMTVDWIYPGSLSPPSEARQAAVIASLTDQVRREYGAELASVDVRYGRDGLTPMYVGEFRLKGVPLVFSFRELDDDLKHYGDRSSAFAVDTGDLGAERFVRLARRFHEDFPTEKTMACVVVFSPDELPAGLRQVAERPGPTVYVHGGGLDLDPARSLGLYSWDPHARAWRLAHRGPIPDQ